MSAAVDALPPTGAHVDRLFVFLVSSDGVGEGVLATSIDGIACPIIAVTADAASSLRGFAEQAVAQSDCVVTLVRFDSRHDVERFRRLDRIEGLGR